MDQFALSARQLMALEGETHPTGSSIDSQFRRRGVCAQGCRGLLEGSGDECCLVCQGGGFGPTKVKNKRTTDFTLPISVFGASFNFEAEGGDSWHVQVEDLGSDTDNRGRDGQEADEHGNIDCLFDHESDHISPLLR